MIPRVPMTALILAGGKSSRMGTDKALLKLGKRTVLEELTWLANSLFDETFIIASQEKNYQRLDLGHAIVLNDFWENNGPLVGLYTGLSYSTHPVSCVLTCDMPFVDTALLRGLAEAWNEEYDAVCPVDADGDRQPFPGIYTRASRHFIRLLLDRRETAMRRLFDVLVFQTMKLGKKKSELLLNMNNPQDYVRVIEKINEAGYGLQNSLAS
jgi:molybdenum cofactor guanylyltransferase